MLKLLLRGAPSITILLCLCSAITIYAGTCQPNHPVLAGIGECENRPCWYGIAPGITTVDEANAIIEELIRTHGGYWSETDYGGEGAVSGIGQVLIHYAEGLVEGYYLTADPDLALGDALSLLEREAAEVTWNCWGQFVIMQGWWTFSADALTLDSPTTLQIDAYLHMPIYPLYGTRWRGVYAGYLVEELGDPGCG